MTWPALLVGGMTYSVIVTTTIWLLDLPATWRVWLFGFVCLFADDLAKWVYRRIERLMA